MNLIEFPIGLADRRVPIDPMTRTEIVEIRFDSFITEGGAHKDQHWVARGDRGLPRGYDLDIFTAIMGEWSKSNFQNRLISLGSTYSILKTTGKLPLRRKIIGASTRPLIAFTGFRSRQTMRYGIGTHKSASANTSSASSVP
jgi:hypothetical protein